MSGTHAPATRGSAPAPAGRGPWVATPLVAEETAISQVRFNADGLVPAVVQEATTGAVLMVAWMNETALRRSLATGRSWFWSRSRGELWCKGETSGDRQWVREARLDCDGDTVLLVVDQEGRGACHTGDPTCFNRPLGHARPA